MILPASGGLGLQAELSGATLVLVVTLFALSFFFSGSETSMFSLQKLDRIDLAAQGRAGSLVDSLIRRGRRPLLSTILIGNETVNVALTAVAAAIAAAAFPDWPGINILILTPLLVLISEITPKIIAFRYPRRWATLAVWPLTAFYFTVWPVRVGFNLVISGLARIFGAHDEHDDDGLEEQELMVIMERGTAAGAVDQVERDIIEAVFEFDDLTVDRVMTPRPDILSLPLDTPWTDLVARCEQTQFSRIPLYQGKPEDIVGVLLVKDLLRHKLAPPEGPRQLRSLLLPPTFVPATKSADDMLEELLKRRLHMAFVVDEHGTLVGLITLDDLLDELLGDELDDSSEESEISRIRPDTLTVRAAIDVDDFAEETGIELPEGDWNTVGGFVFHELGRLPRQGDRVAFEDYTFVVAHMDGRRIVELEVQGARKGVGR